jgi:hypothetical protein
MNLEGEVLDLARKAYFDSDPDGKYFLVCQDGRPLLKRVTT